MKTNDAAEAIDLAMTGKWEEAATANRKIIEASPRDIEAHNRLGKALTEMGNYEEAQRAYERTLELDPINAVAKRNIQRLAQLKNSGNSIKPAAKLNPRFFIEETGKAKVVTLHRIGPRENLSQLNSGDPIGIRLQNRALILINRDGQYLGEIEPRLASRLAELMKGGNKYEAAVISVRDERVKVILRETYQHPGLTGHLSFPPMAIEETRPYLKDTFVKYEIDELPPEAEEGPEAEGEGEPLWEEHPEEEDVDELV